MYTWEIRGLIDLLMKLPGFINDRLQTWWSTVIFWIGFAGLLLAAYLGIRGFPSGVCAAAWLPGALLTVVALAIGPPNR